MTGEYFSHSPEETFELGRQTGLRLRGGEILLLDGSLGAGKTTFAKGLAAGLGLDPDEVTSPSFTLVNRYSGRLVFYHLDLYRLDAGTAAAAVDLDELLGEQQAVLAIEWSTRLGNYQLPPPVCRITIDGDGDDPRLIALRTEG